MFEISSCEIFDWWNDARLHVRVECENAAEQLIAYADAQTSDLSAMEVLGPSSSVTKEIETEIHLRIEAHNVALAAFLETTTAKSMHEVGDGTVEDGMTWDEKSAIAASGVAAVGAAGMVVGAAAAFPTTTTIFFVIPAAAGSWPLFLMLGTGALAVAAISPTVTQWGLSRFRERYRAHLEAVIRSHLTDDTEAAKSPSCYVHFCAQLDELKDKRLEALRDVKNDTL